jgi:hypothetical protein
MSGSSRVVSIHAMPRESFLRVWLRLLRAQCSFRLFFRASLPETEPARRLRLARAGAEVAEHILEFKPDERALVVARALELANVPVMTLPTHNAFSA